MTATVLKFGSHKAMAALNLRHSGLPVRIQRTAAGFPMGFEVEVQEPWQEAIFLEAIQDAPRNSTVEHMTRLFWEAAEAIEPGVRKATEELKKSQPKK